MAGKKKKTRVSSLGGEGIRQYTVAAVVTAVVVWGVYQYAAVRYGVAGISTLNKSLAASTLFLLGVVLLIGPLSRMFTVFDRFLKYRKELGIMTFFTGAAHVYLSMFALARRGPFGFYQSQPLSAYTGLTGLLIMFVLLVISNATIERAIGAKAWWKLQYWGARLAFVAAAVHFIVLKYAGMVRWLAERGAGEPGGQMWLPPISILATAWTAVVVAVRMSELLGATNARRITQLSFLAVVGFTVWLLW